eukprot:2911367-Rhodomonas_salina.1
MPRATAPTRIESRRRAGVLSRRELRKGKEAEPIMRHAMKHPKTWGGTADVRTREASAGKASVRGARKKQQQQQQQHKAAAAAAAAESSNKSTRISNEAAATASRPDPPAPAPAPASASASASASIAHPQHASRVGHAAAARAPGRGGGWGRSGRVWAST